MWKWAGYIHVTGDSSSKNVIALYHCVSSSYLPLQYRPFKDYIATHAP